jgi:transketolase
MSSSDLDRLCVNKIRTLAIDAIQKAKSGHPGTRCAKAAISASATYAPLSPVLHYNPGQGDLARRLIEATSLPSVH